MEKIKQALERAREDRSSAGPVQSISVRHNRISRQAPELLVDSKISYTNTRTIELSLDTLQQKRIITGAHNDPASNAYKVLRTHVLQRLHTNQWNTLAVTSPSKGSGKTLTSINLAISMAREVNHTVLLVDMDLRQPGIHHYFFSDEQPGIIEYLINDTELSEILFNPSIERLVILPGSKPIENSSEMLSSPKMVKLVEELKNRYPNRIVIFDMPSLLSCDDMIAFSPYIDTTMIVVEDGGTKKDELKRAYELLENLNVIGTVLNKSEYTRSVYG